MKSTPDSITGISKFLSLVLRHRPEEIGISLDDAGWVSTQLLIAACKNHGRPFDQATLAEVVATNEKKRFEFNEDGTLIRASQGHSVKVELGYTPQAPPDVLYHGTVHRFLDSIRSQGLIKGQRQHVHLSADPSTAVSVGSRRGRPVILSIRARAMHNAGHSFYLSTNGVWLTDFVPATSIDFPK